MPAVERQSRGERVRKNGDAERYARPAQLPGTTLACARPPGLRMAMFPHSRASHDLKAGCHGST